MDPFDRVAVEPTAESLKAPFRWESWPRCSSRPSNANSPRPASARSAPNQIPYDCTVSIIDRILTVKTLLDRKTYFTAKGNKFVTDKGSE
jgi:hypothetical protein